MTDKTKVLETLDPKAFVLALIGAPILVALLGFWLFLIPVFAMVLGGPVYLVFGTPVLLWMVTRFPLDIPDYALAGLLLQFVVLLSLSAILALITLRESDEVLIFMGAMIGLIFAPLWTGTFALLYRRWHRPAQLSLS
jgi:hypothetical protein